MNGCEKGVCRKSDRPLPPAALPLVPPIPGWERVWAEAVPVSDLTVRAVDDNL